MFLFETMLRTRYYIPQTAVRWEYLTTSDTTSLCPHKGMANCEWPNLTRTKQKSLNSQKKRDYNVVIEGKEYRDVIWIYKSTTLEVRNFGAGLFH